MVEDLWSCIRRKGNYTMSVYSGSNNGMWKGDTASYDALHKRVVTARGKPQLCEECGETEGRMEWSNLNGNYSDVNDYARLCVSCHKRLDHERRVETDMMTSDRNVLNGGFRHANRAILTKEQVLEAKQLRGKGWTWTALEVWCRTKHS